MTSGSKGHFELIPSISLLLINKLVINSQILILLKKITNFVTVEYANEARRYLILLETFISSVTRLELSGSRYSVSRAHQWPGALGTYITKSLIKLLIDKRLIKLIIAKLTHYDADAD